MYPNLESSCAVKGSIGNFFILMFDTFHEYTINDLQARVLSFCNGENDVDTISEFFNIGRENLMVFLREMLNIGILHFDTSKKIRPNNFRDFTTVTPPYLKEVHLDITSRCNLRCLHCYQTPYLAGSIKEMGTNEIKDVISQLSEMNVSKLVISGGEPFLRNDLVDIIDYAFRNKIAVPTIFTNGTVSNENFRKLCYHGKPFTIAISLEGCTPEMNDFIRGRFTFAKILNSLSIVFDAQSRGSGIKCVIDTMIHPMNFDKLKKMFLFLSELGVQRWRVSLPRNQGAFEKNRDKLEINLKAVLEEYEKFIRWYLDYGIKVSKLDIQIESFFRTAMINRKEISVFTPNSCCCEYKREALAIKPNGDVTACTAFTNIVLGNVKKKSIREIWQSSETQQIKQMKAYEVEACRDCEFLYLCGTGCRRMALAQNGSVRGKDESMRYICFFSPENYANAIVVAIKLKTNSLGELKWKRDIDQQNQKRNGRRFGRKTGFIVLIPIAKNQFIPSTPLHPT